MAKRQKKAFTITELVIVIAVVAILAAVLIPTFANIVDKAQESSDTQAVANMNRSLQNAEQLDGKPDSLSEVLEILEGDGMNAHEYVTLKKGTKFVWVPSINRVLYVTEKNYSVLYPEEYKDLALGEGGLPCLTLEGAIKGDDSWQTVELQKAQLAVPKGTADANPYGVVKSGDKITAIKVDTPARLVSAAEYLDKQDDKKVDLYLGGDINLAGAEWNSIDRLEGNFNGNGYTISNLRMTDTTAYSDQIVGGSLNNYTFYAFVSIFKGSEFKNVTLENVNIDMPGIAGNYVGEGGGTSFANHTVAGAIGGIYKLGTEGEIATVVSGVTVSGNIVGHSRVGGIVGFIGGIGGTENLMRGSVKIEECFNNATLVSDYTDPAKAGYATAGGIVSIVIQTANDFTLEITGCDNNAPVTGMHAAGILARLSMNGSVLFNDCKNTDVITTSVIEGVAANSSLVTDKADYEDLVGTASGIFDTFQSKTYFDDTNTINGVSVSGVLIRDCSNSGELKTDIGNNSTAFTAEICVHGTSGAQPWSLRNGTLSFEDCTGRNGQTVSVATQAQP